MKHLTPLFTLLLVLLAAGDALALYDLEARRSTAARVPVGILGVIGAEALEDELLEARQVLMADLRRSTVFHARDLELHMAQPPNKVMPPLKIREVALGEVVDAMLWVRLSQQGGQLVLEGHIYDGIRGELVGDKPLRYRGDKASLRTMVHYFVGELIDHYTGEWGITHTRISFVSDLSGSKEVYVMDYDGNAPTRVTADRNIALTPALNPDTKRILYASQKGGGWDIYETDVTTHKRFISFRSPGLNIAPEWHPRGDGYALTVSKDGNREIYQVTADRRIVRLTDHKSEDLSPTWSPDGRKVAFTSNRGGSPQIYVMKSRGGRARRVTYEGDYNTEPDWSPRGDMIVYTCRIKGLFHICVTTPDGRQVRQLTGGPWDDESPVVSPDGRHIAFASSRGGRNDIYMMDTDGGNVERLTYNGANNTSPDWAGPINK